MNIKHALEAAVGPADGIYLNDVEIDPSSIKAVMINEVAPPDPANDFYGQPDADYLKSALPLFQGAGAAAHSIQDILRMGIYLTNAVKSPKIQYAIEKSRVEASIPYLEKELSLFPNAVVIMLMGDVAKKAFNTITKKTAGKNAVPAVSTYKLRNQEIYYHGIRVMPSYIMTGGNLSIEKSKVKMATEDIAVMLGLIR